MGHTKKILLVEDDHESQRYMQVLLGGEFRLLYAESAVEGWSILNRERIDLILMDISLRGEESGLDLTRRIRKDQRFSSLPIVAVTAHAFPEDRSESLSAGCDAYLAKPFLRNDLFGVVREYLRAS